MGGGGWADLIAQGGKDTWANAWGTYNAYEANERWNDQYGMWREERNWQDDMTRNKYQYQVADLKAAGLNPMLAVSQGAPNPGGAVGIPSNTETPASAGARAWSEVQQSASASQLATASVEKIRADADLAKAQAGEVEARTPTYAVSIDKMKQEIVQSVEQLKLIEAATGREVASAGALAQQTENLRQAVPQIQQTVKLLQGQTAESWAKAGLSSEEAAKVHQYVQENLPRIQAQVLRLEQLTRQADLPGHAQSGEFYTNSALAPVAAMVKALSPLVGLLK